jgi:hypothetical protein
MTSLHGHRRLADKAFIMAINAVQSGRALIQGASVLRFGGWLCLVLGAVLLFAAAVLGILAIQQATVISAYHHARACPAGTSSQADCLHAITGSVAGVTEFHGDPWVRSSSEFALDVRTASTTVHMMFGSDSPMLAGALNGDRAVVTMWRGVPVSVAIGGRSEATTSVPDTVLATNIGGSEVLGGVAVLFIIGALAVRQNLRAGGTWPPIRSGLPAALWVLGLGGIIVVISGAALDGKASRLGLDLAVTSGALIPVLGLAARLGISGKRWPSESMAYPAAPPCMASSVLYGDTPVGPAALPVGTAQPALRTRMAPARLARMFHGGAVSYLLVVLTVAVLFGILRTSMDGPPARAFRQAPACSGATNLATCVGDFAAVIDGVRAAASGGNGTDISYVTANGAINSWARFDGDVATTARIASADRVDRTVLKIKIWRRSIIGAELGGRWRWAEGDPPGNTIPAVFLAVSLALLLLTARLRIHRRKGSVADSQRVLIDDLGQAAAAVCSVILVWFGFWAGDVLAMAVLAWLGVSVRRSLLFRRLTLAALRPS